MYNVSKIPRKEGRRFCEVNPTIMSNMLGQTGNE